MCKLEKGRILQTIFMSMLLLENLQSTFSGVVFQKRLGKSNNWIS